jgi:NADPH:quinone reductase-like Zn-dependent oxidoreductase
MASALNPLDVKILAGRAEHARQPLPAVLGVDMAGIVVAVGPNTLRFREGDAVFGMAGGVGGHPGSLADYVSVDERLLARKPANLSLRESAAVPLIFITAFTLLPLLTGEGGARHGEILAEATKLAEAGALVPGLDPRHFTLGTVSHAYRLLEAGMARGKLVIDVGEEVAS